MQIRELITNLERGEGSTLSVNSKHMTFTLGKLFLLSGNVIDLPGICGKRSATWESRGYRLKCDFFIFHSCSDLRLNVVTNRYKTFRNPHSSPHVLSLKTYNPKRKEKSGFAVEGIKLHKLMGYLCKCLSL